MTLYYATNEIIAVLGLLGGLFGFIRSIAADRRSRGAAEAADDARSDAVAALSKSADAEERIAKAVEIIAGGTTAIAHPALAVLTRPDAVSWAIEKRLAPSSFRLRNTGTADAGAVSVAEAARTGVIRPGQALNFTTMAPGAVRVDWTEGSVGRQATLAIP